MDTESIRKKLQEYISEADDEKLKAVYSIINEGVIEPYAWWADEDLIEELNQRSDDLKSGKDKGFTLEESMAQLMAGSVKNG